MLAKFFRTLTTGILHRIFLIFIRYPKAFYVVLGLFVGSLALTLLGGKLYQHYWDTDPDRGAVAMDGQDGNSVGALGEKFSTPVYLDQGWNAADSLWFYNTTQGSALMPYDLFLVLEEAGSEELLRSDENMDEFRYLVQKPTSFNPDGLPVGFVKDTYSATKWWYQISKEEKDYIGFTCAACHTGQINYTKPGEDIATAIRIDGGAAMADMVGFLKALEAALYAVTVPGEKQSRYVQSVIDLGNEYSDQQHVIDDTKKWYGVIRAYNVINESTATDKYGRKVNVDYGHARLDAFGRIYNRVLQYVISVEQAKIMMASARLNGRPILTGEQMAGLFQDIEDDVILTDDNFVKILGRLGALGLSDAQELALRAEIFNEANAPVSYPYLWDIVQSTFVQWNGLADNSGAGPLGRNVGEVIGVFGILDWEATEAVWYRPMTWRPRSWLSSFASGQSSEKKHVTFDSSIDVTNLVRLERKLKNLQSPMWPGVTHQGEEMFNSQFGDAWIIDMDKAARGRRLYEQYCISCHADVVRDDPDRLLVSHMSDIDFVQTDPTTAVNSVAYTGASGNFRDIYQATDAGGDVIIGEEAPVIQMLTAAAKGVIATPDRDKNMIRRWLDWAYNIAASLLDNPIEKSMKAGNYRPDTTSSPYNSLLAYKARPLNGIWATAPYLHNGSVPTLYDLLLPSDCSTATDGKCRPPEFLVGAREFDPQKVGIVYEGLDPSLNFTTFDTKLPGNSNSGHEYAAGNTAVTEGEKPLPQMTETERWDLIEYLKTL